MCNRQNTIIFPSKISKQKVKCIHQLCFPDDFSDLILFILTRYLACASLQFLPSAGDFMDGGLLAYNFGLILTNRNKTLEQFRTQKSLIK